MADEAPDSNLVSVLDGEQGTEAQLAAMTTRGYELIDRAFDMVQIIGVDDVSVQGGRVTVL